MSSFSGKADNRFKREKFLLRLPQYASSMHTVKKAKLLLPVCWKQGDRKQLSRQTINKQAPLARLDLLNAVIPKQGSYMNNPSGLDDSKGDVVKKIDGCALIVECLLG